jgi:uncharacterized membrane protein
VQAEERIRPGLTPERVGFFTDAVFAIAMTLLVIDIPKPEGDEFDTGGVSKVEASRNMLHFLGDQSGAFVSYLLAFVVLWVLWRQHHNLFDRIKRLSPKLVAWHLPLLLLIGFLPYPTVVYSSHIGNPVAAALYALTLTGLFGIKAAVQRQALHDDLLPDNDETAKFRTDVRIGWALTWYYAATVLLCWFTPWIQIAWDLGPALASVLNRRRDKRLGLT